MKIKTLISVLLIGITTSLSAQTYPVNLSATLEKGYDKFKKGTRITISALEHEVISDPMPVDNYYLLVDGEKILVKDNIGERMAFQYQNVQDLWDAQIISNVLSTLTKKGSQNELRNEMEKDALDFIDKVKSYNMELNDPYLENYIYGLIAKIAPIDLIDGRPGNINILLLDDPSINACMYPNGTLVLHTGLLACLHTEAELVAVLGHEIAHFILDHSIQNVNKAQNRKKRAEFWAAVATGVTAVAEGVAYSQNRYYMPGAATLGVAALSTAIASEVVDRLGMKYNHQQEYEADLLAIEVLRILKYDPNALATALNRMQGYMIKERSHSMYFQSYSHPALLERVQKAGAPQETRDEFYEKNVSFAVTSTARLLYENRRFRQALPLVSQNIRNQVATSEDFILKANCMMSLFNDTPSNTEILQLINQAKEIDPTNINIYKSEILAYLRLRDFSTSQQLLGEYVSKLQQLRQSLKDMEDDATWSRTSEFTLEEISWAEKMQLKIKNL